jgi:ribosomal-protein-alanine N-acetyltransferase
MTCCTFGTKATSAAGDVQGQSRDLPETAACRGIVTKLAQLSRHRRRRSTLPPVRVIRPLERGDAPELAALLARNRAFLAPFEPQRSDRFFTLPGQEARLDEIEERRRTGTGDVYAILDADEIAGTISLSNLVRGAFQSANVGYWVDRERNGRGLASLALEAIVAEAFGRIGLHRLEAGTLVDNVASQRVLEKNGFSRIGLAHRYLHIAGAWRDHVLYQRVADESWPPPRRAAR